MKGGEPPGFPAGRLVRMDDLLGSMYFDTPRFFQKRDDPVFVLGDVG
jgi:hypothetical protein